MKYFDEKMMYGDCDMYGKFQQPCCYEPKHYEECEWVDEDCLPKPKCKPVKECVKTYKCYYKLYKMCYYRLYKVCPRCGHEFDYYFHRGTCPKCR